MKVQSPLTYSDNILLERTISTQEIIDAYQKTFNIDVSANFKHLETISRYKCLDTGFHFFYPLNIAGDGKFYEQLQQFKWYYMDWKWEHENSLQYLKPGIKVLEIGCAKGAFIKKIRNSKLDSVGLELNEDAVLSGKEDGVKIYNQTIQEHIKTNPEKYDVVCSFQVMEHVVPIREVIQSSIAALKKGGLLIISVPNNDSFLGLSTNYLNMPPHHMGLWNEKVFQSIATLFNLKLVNIHFEPLQAYHKDYFNTTMTEFYLKKYNSFSILGRLLLPKLIPRMTRLFSKKRKAFTIQGVFEKI